MSCDRNYGISIPPCSGHGDCIEDFCYCYPGWTGLADGVLEDGIDCDINIAFIKATAGISMIITFIACVLSMINFDRTKSWVSNRNLIMISTFGFNVVVLFLSIFRLIDPVKYTINTPQSVVITSSTSILQPIGGFFFYFVIKAIANSIEAFLRFLPEETKSKLKSKIDFKLKISILCIVLGFLSTILNILTPIFKNTFISFVYVAVTGSFLIILILNGILTITMIVAETENYIKTSQSDSTNLEDVKKVEKRLRYGRNAAYILFLPFTLRLIFQFWSFSARKATYAASAIYISTGFSGLVANYMFGKVKSSYFSNYVLGRFINSSSIVPEKIDHPRQNIYEVQEA